MRARDNRLDLSLLLGRQRQAFREPFHHPIVMGSRAMLATRTGCVSMQEHRVRNDAPERSSATEDKETAPQFQSRCHGSSNPLLPKEGNGLQLLGDHSETFPGWRPPQADC